jgi:hypothetical protein
MTAYRFLYPAEEEMNEASAFYESASDGLGLDFLADVQFIIDNLCCGRHYGRRPGYWTRLAG